MNTKIITLKLLLLLTFLSLFITNSISCNVNSNKFNDIILNNLRHFVLIQKDKGEKNMEDIIFVLNITELDTIKGVCNFSISYIRNSFEIKSVNSIGYIKVEDEFVIIRTKLNVNFIKNILNFHYFSEKSNVEIKKRICDNAKLHIAITYSADCRVVEFNGIIIERLEDAKDWFNIEKKYWIMD